MKILPIPFFRIKKDAVHKVAIIICNSKKRDRFWLIAHWRGLPSKITLFILNHGKSPKGGRIFRVKRVFQKPPRADNGGCGETTRLKGVLGDGCLIYMQIFSSHSILDHIAERHLTIKGRQTHSSIG